MNSVEGTELHMRVEPGMWTRWYGTEQQLRDAGLLPADVEAPAGWRVAEWTADGTDFALWRYRRPGVGHAGADKRDQWLLQAAPSATRGIGPAGGALVVAALDAKAAAQEAISGAAGIGSRVAAADADVGFQRLMGAILPRLA